LVASVAAHKSAAFGMPPSNVGIKKLFAPKNRFSTSFTENYENWNIGRFFIKFKF
jgi:hypothetical protein